MHYSYYVKRQPCDPEKSRKQRKRIIIWSVVFLSLTAICIAGFLIFTPETREARTLRIERERIAFFNSIPREDILHDIDYMLNTLEHNFPFLDSIYERYGVDMVELGKDLRSTLEDDTFNPDIEEFITLINDYLRQGRGIGHLRPISRTWLVAHHMWLPEKVITPQSLEFYGEFDEIDFQEANRAFRREKLTTTDIIEEDRIGYMKIHSFAMYQSIEHNNVQPFFDEIADFEHLIIDLRGNGGGFTSTMLFLISPLIEWNIGSDFYLFFPQENQIFFHLESMGFNRERLSFNFYPAFNERARLSSAQSRLSNEPDWVDKMLTDSEFYINARISMFPSRTFTSLRTDFNGQIWLLTDGDSASMSEWVTAILRINDMAIIVGERTAGIFGVPIFGGGLIFPLPNTGMLIEYDFAQVYDRHGRLLSNGIDPDYWNRPGMDALETTLALINEGAYR